MGSEGEDVARVDAVAVAVPVDDGSVAEAPESWGEVAALLRHLDQALDASDRRLDDVAPAPRAARRVSFCLPDA